MRAEEVHDANIRIIGMWGSGWLSRYGADAKPQLVKLAASEVLLTADFAARDLPPAIYSREAVPGLENADSVDDAGHRFRAIEALCPQRGIGACVSFEMRCPCELLWARALFSPLFSHLSYILLSDVIDFVMPPAWCHAKGEFLRPMSLYPLSSSLDSRTLAHSLSPSLSLSIVPHHSSTIRTKIRFRWRRQAKPPRVS